MKARALIASASFDPTQLKVIGDAFDKAWTQVAPSITSSPVTLEAARLKLANVVLQIAKGGLIEIDWLAQEALRITFGTRTD